MISQQEVIEIALNLIGSTKALSRYLDTSNDRIEDFLNNKEEMPLSLYLQTQILIEKEVDANIESYFSADFHDSLILKHVRKRLNLSYEDMARILGIHGENAIQLVKLMENGSIPMIGPILKLLKILDQSSSRNQISS
ncbi:hypothetical protein [Pseudobacteriovorax antillogorgiicola]|uniref:Uncharacterized protein n=1 Tax=Pseudobacteriovorax antillogorgiicola TaxID=1513793 RepID=A0A1Y6BB47_9BACT|nr:hypothetical protein [Pseudobacteriovorax antillogorgiicola]TCS57479.1 hypothetical protein EDD56_103219 [Pseudobacteriovorax antillogorgiicola]SMF00558.1 hypothetical protein SAMN06296036_103114 [Pseudobacteriovorax antillogorgiicola]